MRPASDVRQALVNAAQDLHTARGGASMAELAEHARVGRDVVRYMVPSMLRSGTLYIVGQRRVGYRNRPVALYAPGAPQRAGPTVQEATGALCWAGLSRWLVGQAA
jgi:hypothetical protein